MLERLTWAEISIRDYSYNLSQIKRLIGPKVKLMAVIKANAYGHGIVEMAKQAERLRAEYLGVVCLYEGRLVKDAGVRLPTLVLNYIDAEGAKGALDSDLTLNVMDEEVLRTLDKYARKKGKRAKIHVKVDSGMHRAGLLPDDALKFIPKIENYKNVFLEGIFTHFATSDEKDLSNTFEQLKVFNKCLNILHDKKINPPIIHAANSGATLRIPDSYFNMVRPGIISYGLPPSGDFKLPFNPRPVLQLKSKIVQIRRIGRGETVGYGRAYKADRETLVGLIPIGYGDGYRRGPVNSGFVLIKNSKAKILGRVSMDQTSIDLTEIPKAKIGDEVIIISKIEGSGVSASEIAQRWGTINYEVVSSLASRVSRVYLEPV